MTDLLTRAELAKLARLLDTTEAELAALAVVDAQDLRALREHAAAALFERHAERFGAAAAAAKIVPAALAAKLAQIAIGPLLTAQIAGLLDPAHAAALAARLPVDFLTDVALYLDPRRAEAVLPRIPEDMVIGVARELAARGEYITMGQLVDVLPATMVGQIVEQLDDDTALLQAACYANHPDRLSAIVAGLPVDRLERLGHTALTGSAELQLAALSVLSRVDEQLKTELLAYAGEAPPEVLDRFAALVTTERLLPKLLSALRH